MILFKVFFIDALFKSAKINIINSVDKIMLKYINLILFQ